MKELEEKVDLLEKTVAKLTNMKVNKETEKLEQLEIVVKALSQKVLSLEIELNEFKRKKKSSEGPEEQDIFNLKAIDQKEVEEILMMNSNYNSGDDKEEYLQEKNKKEAKDEESKPTDSKEDFFNCVKCKYKCKKELSLKKHMTNKHEEHECEECGKNLPTSFELLLHTTKHHSKKCEICDKVFET